MSECREGDAGCCGTRDAGAHFEVGPGAHCPGPTKIESPIIVRVGADHARGERSIRAREVSGQPIVRPTRAPRDAESVLPSQRRPERAPLRQGVELLDEVLYAVPRG